jgi:predicted RNA-binding Zn-ribbon protein involved in translation (DUF1610 family)
MPGTGARFFCENCGAEVDRDTGRCPSCGRVFSSVRCPQCGFTGEETLFKKGCPVCGYCARNENAAPKTEPDANGKLPFWVYVVAALGFALAAVILFFRLR